MSVFEGKNKDVSSEESVRVDNVKVDKLELGKNFDFSKEIAELEQSSQQFKHERTFFQKMKACEFELHFENKMHMVRLLGGFAAFAGVLSGVDQSIISGAMIGMKEHLHTNDNQVSLISSLMPLGAMTGSLMMTPLNEWWGRKKALLISCVWYTVGAIMCALAHNYKVMYAGRFLLGIGVGIEGGCVGVYIAESVPANVRGNLVSLYQFSIALGEVMGYAIAAIFFEVKGGWRYMLGSSLVFSSILFAGLFFLPESPRWLAHKNRIGESFLVWKRLRDISDPDAQLEFIEMRQSAYEESERRKRESRLQAWSDLFTIPRNRRALVYASIMVSLGQLTGVNAVMYYMSTLMGQIGFNEKKSVFMSLVGGGSLLIGTIPAILWMDRFGRRTWGMNIVGFFIGLALVGGGYKIDIKANLAAAEGVYLTGIILYMGFFGAYACLTWVCPSESFSLQTRTMGMSICSFLLYLWAFTVTYNFTRMKNAFTYTGLTLGFYGGIAFIGFIYQLLFMPETKDKTLEEIDDLFSMPSAELVKTNIRNMKRYWGKK
ncbi:uncharacterized protein KQ657_003837 [Scheffersomyces spartinae]|uniref:Major facilitator superfamily (MFS) profile domain-containing protein n=1 Tax=Scheffersomyces spartinae TaxID=45513 RepID=A0A9P7VDH5_9ASCO|nr:uncharacterized protein KQ657_003837 [Scheffersomyces spartinae]KAG7195309.1 hypothetical protein KQ657_003837 [Scheffersomyces spartinae]